jgi:hypothetical protein
MDVTMGVGEVVNTSRLFVLEAHMQMDMERTMLEDVGIVEVVVSRRRERVEHFLGVLL